MGGQPFYFPSNRQEKEIYDTMMIDGMRFSLYQARSTIGWEVWVDRDDHTILEDGR